MFHLDTTTFAAMKSTGRPTSQTEEKIPDFSRRPHRIHLEQVVEVAGFSKLKLRPIRLDDESKMVEFHRGIPQSMISLISSGSVALTNRAQVSQINK